ncbi:hypothetical protein Pan181_29400 [Aeoliella mucimassa]|uniref:Uncharacterized protein n=2 Tax=Aeoliella mucimassa TaxID=2527972 RepID=A0A518APS6_9BACT|nr:hypothetical protein Pan181_29400 [Aeoliella mucimassa]
MEAAERLGVAPNELRSWERSGKIVWSYRTVSGYFVCTMPLLDDCWGDYKQRPAALEAQQTDVALACQTLPFP